MQVPGWAIVRWVTFRGGCETLETRPSLVRPGRAGSAPAGAPSAATWVPAPFLECAKGLACRCHGRDGATVKLNAEAGDSLHDLRDSGSAAVHEDNLSL